MNSIDEKLEKMGYGRKDNNIPTVAQTNREALYEIMQLLGEEYSDGYVGNYESWGDDTTHYIFQSRTNENGLTENKSYGGYESKDNHRLLITAIELLKKTQSQIDANTREINRRIKNEN